MTHSAENDLVVATIRTRHPDRYVLVNEHDGSRWRIAPSGHWINVIPPAEGR